MKIPGPAGDVIARLIPDRSKARHDGLLQSQREAMVDAMLYCMFADDFDDPAEHRIMDRSVARLTWNSNLGLESYIASASSRIQTASANPDTEQQFLADLANRLKTPELRFQTLQACKILLYSDLVLPEEEVRALRQMSRAFRE